MSFLGVIAFIVALLFSVMVHEAGHFVTARHFQMKVTEFFLGFGKRLWSFKRGETEFGIKAIPAGGYCRIVGMSVNEEVSPEDTPRLFYLASAPKRLIVLGAGSFLHFVLGFLILFVLLAGVGTTSVTNVVGQVSPCLTVNSDSKCAIGAKPSPAKIAGLQAGDKILSINGKKFAVWSDAVKMIRNSPNREIKLLVSRSGQDLEFSLTPEAHKLNGKIVGFIGVQNKMGNVRLGALTSVTNSFSLTGQLMKSSVSSLFSLPTKIPALVRQTFGHEKRDASGLVGVVGVARVSAQTASDSKLGVREKIATFLIIIASLNIFVGVFNLFPLLPLDGGHMAVAIVDGLRRKWAQLRKRAFPEPINVERLMPVTIVVFALLAALSLLLLAADIFNPINISQ
jgi:membrane-associated protease RseP (regulator of RpoE activity)